MIGIEWLALAVSAGLLAFTIFTYVRAGGWNAAAAARDTAKSQGEMKQALSALSEKVNGLPTAATISSHDERLKAVEARVKDLPTAKQLADMQASILVLKAEVSGRLDTIAAEMRGADTARAGLSKQVDRIEQYLLDQKPGG